MKIEEGKNYAPNTPKAIVPNQEIVNADIPKNNQPIAEKNEFETIARSYEWLNGKNGIQEMRRIPNNQECNIHVGGNAYNVHGNVNQDLFQDDNMEGDDNIVVGNQNNVNAEET